MQRVKYLIFLLLVYACQPSTTALPLMVASSTAERSLVTSTPQSSTSPATTLPPSVTTPSPADTTPKTPLDALPPTITVLYDNIEFDPRLETAWGFSALIERDGQIVLFDTGGEGSILLKNFSSLGIEPGLVRHVVLSHSHGDHTGGLDAFLNTGVQPTLYIPPSFPASFKNTYKQQTTLVEVMPGYLITEGVLSTGELGVGIPEQALIVRTTMGMIILTGCAHPGIVQLIEQAIRLTGDPVYLVMGGFHLREAGLNNITTIVDEFQQMGVEKVAPSHCTGEQAIEIFREAYGDDFVQSGAGYAIVIKP